MTVDGTVKVGVSALVWNSREQFLIGLRTGSHGANEWWLPGGKPDPGETPGEAVVREIKEETNLTIGTPKAMPLWTYDRWPEFNRHFVCVYFSANAYNASQLRVMEPEKCLEWRWVTWSDLWSLDQPWHESINDLRRIVYE